MLRPRVVMNAAVSMDGRLAPASRRKVRLGSDRDRGRMDRLRAASDAILIGAGTLRAEDPPLQVRSEALKRRRVRDHKSPHLLEIVVSRTLELPARARFFRPSPAPRLVVAPRSVGRRALGRVRDRCEVLLVGTREVDPESLLDRLGRRGIETLLVEGGGATFALFLGRELVDEVNLTICPLLIGGVGAPTLFDGPGFDALPFPRMALDLCRREEEEVYLRYRRI